MRDQILYGDCLSEMAKIANESVDLIYLDPPFFSDKKHKLKNRKNEISFSFSDCWLDENCYAAFLYERITKMKALLKPSGSIFVHCDKYAEHIVRAILDEVFGQKQFQAEIIWSYKRWSNAKKGLLPSHQNIYFYAKSKDFKFNTFYTEYSAATNLDQIQQSRVKNNQQKTVYRRDEKGEVVQGREKKGVPLSDVWEIPYLNPKAKERVGYPTQKPLVLLEQIIKLVTDEGDLVLDPFCGSGTTCVAAKILKRAYIGIDQSEQAIELSLARLSKPVKTESALIKKGRDAYQKTGLEALSLLDGIELNIVNRHKGIDAILVELYQQSPVLVRIQKSAESLDESIAVLLKAMKIKGSKKSFLIQVKQEFRFLSDAEIASGLCILKMPTVQALEHLSEGLKLINKKEK